METKACTGSIFYSCWITLQGEHFEQYFLSSIFFSLLPILISCHVFYGYLCILSYINMNLE